DMVDEVVSERLEEKLYDLLFDAEESGSMIERYKQSEVLSSDPKAQAWRDEIVGKLIEERQEKQASARAILDHVSALKQQVQRDLGKLDESVIDVQKKIAQEQREYSVAKDVMSDTDIRQH